MAKYTSLLLAASLSLFSIAQAEQSLEIDSTSDAQSYSSSVSYISGTISYAINTNTLVISYSTDSNSQIVGASATTVGNKNGGNTLERGGIVFGGLIAGLMLL